MIIVLNIRAIPLMSSLTDYTLSTFIGHKKCFVVIIDNQKLKWTTRFYHLVFYFLILHYTLSTFIGH